jgi:hypothetical protein
MIAGYTAGVGDWGRDEVFEYAGHLEGSSLALMSAWTSSLPHQSDRAGNAGNSERQELAVVPWLRE